MEDADEKIRRNLLLISVVVVTIWLLDFQVSPTIKLFGVAESTNVSHRKFWALAGVLILYFGLRYRFDDTVRRKFAGIRQELESQYLVVVAPKLEQALQADIDSEVPCPKSVVLHETVLNEYGEPKGPFSLVGLEFHSFWSGTGLAKFAGRKETQYGLTDFSPALLYTLSGYLRFKAMVFSLLRLLFYSRFGIETFLPVAMATFALSVCAIKITIG